jgi:hypothetical protein
MFGDSNLQRSAEFRIDALRMADHGAIALYITNFRTSAAETGWDQEALRFAFKKGLASRILDELAKMDVDPTLEALIVASKKIDDRHWERGRERKLFSSTPKPPGERYKDSSEPSKDSSKFEDASNFLEHFFEGPQQRPR